MLLIYKSVIILNTMYLRANKLMPLNKLLTYWL